MQNTTQILEETNQIDWTGILNLIHLTDMEKMLVEQYKNGENLNIRIRCTSSIPKIKRDGSRGFWNRWILTVRAGFWRLAAETDSSGKMRSHPC